MMNWKELYTQKLLEDVSKAPAKNISIMPSGSGAMVILKIKTIRVIGITEANASLIFCFNFLIRLSRRCIGQSRIMHGMP